MEDKSAMLQLHMCDTIRREQLLSPDDVVLVAFSGGADSTALLHALCAYRDDGGVAAVMAAHVHHGLRGDEADADERAVTAFCRSLGVELFCHHADVAALAATQKCGVEEAGRAVRYTFLEQTAETLGAKIATAHTLNDQAETLLLYMARGCGLHGLAGMPVKRGRIVRPLLSCTREMVEDYCTAHGLPYVTDSTNASDCYARNRLRADALPALMSVCEGALANIGRLTESCREDDAYLTSLADAFIAENGAHPTRTAMAALPLPIQKRVWRRLAADGDLPALSNNRLAALGDSVKTGRAVSLPDGVEAVWQGRPQRLYWTTAASALWPDPIPLSADRSVDFAGQTYGLRLLSIEEYKKYQKIHKKVLNYACDYDRICGSLVMRAREIGDYIHPAGRKVGKTVKKWMIEQGVPAHLRQTVPVVCDDVGVVLVAGIGCDERVRISDETVNVAVLTSEISNK